MESHSGSHNFIRALEFGGISAGWMSFFIWILDWHNSDGFGGYDGISPIGVRLPAAIFATAVYLIVLAMYFYEYETDSEKSTSSSPLGGAAD